MQQVTDPVIEIGGTLFSRVVDDLEVRGYSIQPNGLPEPVVSFLVGRLSTIPLSEFSRAAVGRGTDATRNRFVRRNKIAWIEDDDGDNPWATWTSELQSALNKALFLGLFSFESHFTRYEPGDYYRRHRDAFQGERNRIISLVTYLNDGWQPDQGGELLLYPGGNPITIQPQCGTVVIFLSEEMPHEVLTCNRTRFGVAGWFRLNSGLGPCLDPPR